MGELLQILPYTVNLVFKKSPYTKYNNGYHAYVWWDYPVNFLEVTLTSLPSLVTPFLF